MTATLPAKRHSTSRLHSPSRLARAVLRDTVLSLLETGCNNQDITAALDCLKVEAKGDSWQKVLEGRERARRMQNEAATRSAARRRGQPES